MKTKTLKLTVPYNNKYEFSVIFENQKSLLFAKTSKQWDSYLDMEYKPKDLHITIKQKDTDFNVDDYIIYKNQTYKIIDFDAVGLICYPDYKFLYHEVEKIIASTNDKIIEFGKVAKIDENFILRYVKANGNINDITIEYVDENNVMFIKIN